MKLKALKKIETKEYELSKVISWVKEFLDQLTGNQFIKGQYLEVSVTTSGIITNHGLGETPTGWIITDNAIDSRVWRTSWSDKTITLRSSVNTTIRIWVF